MRRSFTFGPVTGSPPQSRRSQRPVGGHRPPVTPRGRAVLEQQKLRGR